MKIKKLTTLYIMAASIWLLIGVSFIAREYQVINIMTEFSNSFSLINNFFNLAESRMKEPWEHFDEDTQAFDARFQKQKEDFNDFSNKMFLRQMATMGYDVSDGTVRVKKESLESPKKIASPNQKEFKKNLTACEFGENPDAYVACLQKQSQKNSS